MADHDLHGIGWLLAAKVACCAGLLVASGVVSVGTLAGWAGGAGLPWLAGGIAALGAAFWWRRRHSQPRTSEADAARLRR